MTRRVRTAAVEMPLARVDGPRWCVAMCDTEWSIFLDVIGLVARNRLLAILDYFCDHGEANLPPGAFRWLSGERVPKLEARQGAFEAHGVVLRGRAALAETKRTFFVTAIDIDPPTEPAPRRRPARTDDPRQGRLPFSKPERN